MSGECCWTSGWCEVECTKESQGCLDYGLYEFSLLKPRDHQEWIYHCQDWRSSHYSSQFTWIWLNITLLYSSLEICINKTSKMHDHKKRHTFLPHLHCISSSRYTAVCFIERNCTCLNLLLKFLWDQWTMCSNFHVNYLFWNYIMQLILKVLICVFVLIVVHVQKSCKEKISQTTGIVKIGVYNCFVILH